VVNAVKKYIEEAIHELRQVQWPTKNYAIRISTIAGIFVFSSAVAIALIDFVLSKILLLTH